MSRSPLARVALAAGIAGAATGAAVAGGKLAARRMRARPDVAAADLELPVATEHRLASHDEGELYVVEAGSGPPIVLSHGVTLSVRVWAEQLRSLAAAGFRVIAFDHRGHGSSTVGSSGHGVDQIAHDLRSVLEGLDLHDAVVVGHSMGGIAVQAFCIRHPDIARERVAGIVLLSTLARSPLSANPRVGRWLELLGTRLPDSGPALAARDLGFMLARVGFGRDPRPAHVEATRQMLVATTPETRRDAGLGLLGLDLTPRLGEIDRPTLVIGGTADVLTPIAESRRIARRIPGARLVELSGGGHMLMFERARELDTLVAEFAESVQAPAARAADARPR